MWVNIYLMMFNFLFFIIYINCWSEVSRKRGKTEERPRSWTHVISSPVAHVTYVHAKFPPTLIGVICVLHTLHVTTCLLLSVDTNWSRKFYDLYVKLVYTLTNDQVNQHLQYSYVHELMFYPWSLLCLQVYYLLHITEVKPGLECTTIIKSGKFFY